MKNEDFKIGDLVQLPTEVKGHIKRKKENTSKTNYRCI